MVRSHSNTGIGTSLLQRVLPAIILIGSCVLSPAALPGSTMGSTVNTTATTHGVMVPRTVPVAPRVVDASITVNPKPASSGGSLAVSKPPSPTRRPVNRGASDTLITKPRGEDPDAPDDRPDSTDPPSRVDPNPPPRMDPNPETDNRGRDNQDEKTPAKPAASDKNDVSSQPRERRKLQSQGSLLDAPLPTFGGSLNLMQTPREDSPQQPADNEFEPGQVLYLTENFDQASRVDAILRAKGFRTRSRSALDGLGFVLTIARVPSGISVSDAVTWMTNRFPDIDVDANHLYTAQAGKNYANDLIQWPLEEGCNLKTTIGLLDTPVDVSDNILSGREIEIVNVLPAGVPQPSGEHGTAVASILTGRRIGGFAGLLPGAKLIAANVFRDISGNNAMDSTVAWIVTALSRVSSAGARVINMSLGGKPNRILKRAVDALQRRSVTLVAAGGNGGVDGEPVYPAAYDAVIAVTAIDANKQLHRQASRGNYLDFAAPGVDLYVPLSNGSKYLSGSSYAAPFITAAVAVLLETHGGAAEQLKNVLAASSEDLGEKGRDNLFGWGLPDLSTLCAG